MPASTNASPSLLSFLGYFEIAVLFQFTRANMYCLQIVKLEAPCGALNSLKPTATLSGSWAKEKVERPLHDTQVSGAMISELSSALLLGVFKR